MSWITSPRTSAEELGPLAKKKKLLHRLRAQRPLHHGGLRRAHPGVLDRATVPEDFDYDDITVGQTLLNARRRRADRSEEEGLSTCQSSSSTSHDRTVKPVVCSHVTSAQETQRRNSKSEQIRTLLERQREQILADCQAENRNHELQADYDRRKIQKMNETIESQKEETCRAYQGNEIATVTRQRTILIN